MYVIFAILVFGILIATHELGHFTAAKTFGVKVNEYSIGMGPAIFKKQGKETLYALRILPIGGYCALEGEDGDNEDPRAFTNQSLLKKIVILFAGAFTNFVTGAIVIAILFSSSVYFVAPRIDALADGFLYGGEDGLMVGDEIYSINGHRVFYSDDFSTFMMRAGDTVTMKIKRGGEKITLKDYGLKRAEYIIDGEKQLKYGVTFTVIDATAGEKLKYSAYTCFDFVRSVFLSLEDLFSGRAGIKDLTGVVGIVDTISDVGSQSETVRAGIENVLYLSAFIAVCLAVSNLLPIPALDGGRIFLLLVTFFIEKILGRKIDPKYEAYINAVGMVLLLGLMAVVMVFDIGRIIHG